MITMSTLGNNGRFGNQMFQYAMLKGLSLRKGYKIGLPFDNEGFCLNHYFDIKEDCIDSMINFRNYFEDFFHYDDNINQTSDNINFRGYFQSEKYFLDCAAQIKEIFTFKSHYRTAAYAFLDDLSYKTDKKIVGLHVRRGDYLQFPNFHPTCTSDYYKKALEHFPESEYTVLIFSDDIEWCKTKFIGERFYFSPYSVVENEPQRDGIYKLSNDKSGHEMCLYAECNAHIIANSSFSWWGAWLGETDEKIIAPKIWFGKDGPQDTQDLIPERWITI